MLGCANDNDTAGVTVDWTIPSATIPALASAFLFGAALVLSQFGLRHMSPLLGGAISVPSATLLFWVLASASWPAGAGAWDWRAVAIFAAVGMLFPATVTLLSFEANRRMGPNVAGSVGNLAPLFAVVFAVLALGETLQLPQAAGIAAIVGGVMLLYARPTNGAAMWQRAAILLPLAAAAIRGAVQPAIKAGLGFWPDPIAAVVIGYTVSSLIIAGTAASQPRRGYTARGIAWFAATGFCNGLAVLAMYSALGNGPVTLVSPLVATYPLVTLALSTLFLRREPPGGRTAAGVAATVAGVVLLLAA